MLLPEQFTSREFRSARIALTMKPESHSATTEPLAHYSLSRYSPGTSSCGTSCVRTSFWSVSPACSTPPTASASNAFPSSINSATLSESAPSMLDNPCKSPDCPPDLSLSASGANASVSTLWLFPRTRVLSAVGVLAPVVFWPRAFVFTAAFFKAGFFFANFFFGVPLFLARFFLTVFFRGFPFFPADPFGFVSFLLVLFLAIGAVYHRHHAFSRKRARRIARKPTGPATQFPPLVGDARPEATILFQLPTDHLTLRQTWHTAFNSQANGRITSGLPTIHPECCGRRTALVRIARYMAASGHGR